ncbi:MAG: DNA double-strand break repair nuclease NurA [Candidatus Ranarchaeia archaeon]
MLKSDLASLLIPSFERKQASLSAIQSEEVFKLLTTLSEMHVKERLGSEIRDLLVTVAGSGSLKNNTGSPFVSLGKALQRINFDSLSHKHGHREVLLEEARQTLTAIDESRIKQLETDIVIPISIHHPTSTLNGLNIVAFDGGSIPIYNYSCSTVFARGGSFGYSQCTGDRHLSLESGINRIWCDVAINVAARPGVLSEEVHKWTLDQCADDVNEEMILQDQVKRTEVYALALVEASAVTLCLQDFWDKIDVVFLDGPQYISREGYQPSLTRINLLQTLGIPSIAVVKNPGGSPVMRGCNIIDTSDTAFFEYLEPGERSPMFLRIEEGKKKLPSKDLRRVFWYYKTMRGFICRYEIPFWCYKKGELAFDKIVAADSALDGGKLSFVGGRADSIARIRQSLRSTMRVLQKSGFIANDVQFSEPYNQERWSDV